MHFTDHLPALLTLLMTATGAAHADEDASPLPPPDLPGLIQCQGDMDSFQSLHGPVESPLQAVALGWNPLPRTNPFMAEYRLLQPVDVFGLSTDHILVSGGTVMAILDQSQIQPARLAAQLELEIALDGNDKFMAGREVLSRDLVDADTGQSVIESAVLGVSTVTSHPGKVLVGCTYSLDLPEDGEGPADDAAPAAGDIAAD